MTRRRTRESSQIRCQVGLIEIAGVGCQRRTRLARSLLDLLQRRLKPDDAGKALRAVANPDAHQPVQVTRADVAAGGNVPDSRTRRVAFNLMECVSHDAVHTRVPESSDEKALQRVNVLRWYLRRRIFLDEFTKGRDRVHVDTTADGAVRGDPAEKERNTWAQAHADQRHRRSESSLFRPQQRTAQRPSDGRPCSSMEIAVLPSGTIRSVASRSAVMTQKHPTKGRSTSAASWNRISARWTRVLVMLTSPQWVMTQTATFTPSA